MPDHIFRDGYIKISLSIVYLKFKSNEIGKDSSGACLGLDGYNLLSWNWPSDWQTVEPRDQPEPHLEVQRFIVGAMMLAIKDIRDNMRTLTPVSIASR
jgi:hypothetical protein